MGAFTLPSRAQTPVPAPAGDITRLASPAATKCLLVLTITTLFLTPAPARAQGDTLSLQNGDRLIGKVNGLVESELLFKTDYIVSEFRVDWKQVARLESRRTFRVALADGRRVTGTIARHPDGQFIVVNADGAAVFGWAEIMGLMPVETTIWAQLKGQINSGFTYNSDDSDTQFSASGSVGYVADRYAVNVSGSSSVSGHSDSEGGTNRNVADVSGELTLAPRWFAAGLLGYLTSDTQDLKFRATTGGGVGRWLARTRRSQLTAFGGLVYTREKYGPSEISNEPVNESANNLEATGSLQYGFHRFKTVDIQAKFTIYPSLSAPGRVRLATGPTLDIEVAHNLYWNFTLYENYDSHPPVTATKNDFGVTNAIAWKF